MKGWAMRRSVFLVAVLTAFGGGVSSAALIQPSDLEYRGAFRLPDWANFEIGWAWSGEALTCYPGGDPNGPSDGYPGSLFGAGHNWNQYISEISIPVPVISSHKNLADLNTASTLQGFQDIRGGTVPFSDYEIPRLGLEYLPAQGSQSSDKLYFCWGEHMQEMETNPSHGWCGLDLAAPQPAGLWRIGDFLNYVANDYIFAIPPEWADIHTPGLRLATGRFRDGGQGAEGPSLIAYGPWNQGNPPPAGTTVTVTPLLLYGSAYENNPPALSGYHHSDEWTGGAWLSVGGRSAVTFVGTKGNGECWYGCPQGPNVSWDDCPGERGFWSTSFHGQIIFYDPADLAAVASGTMTPSDPQPYATLDIDSVLFAHQGVREKYHTGDCAFDRERGLLYVLEPLVDEDKPIVHVWKVGASAPVPTPPTLMPGGLIVQSGDYDGDGTADPAVYRPASALWAVRGISRFYFGQATDIPASGDYDGDGTAEAAVFSRLFSPARWSIRGLGIEYFGEPSDLPVPADYDGDGICDLGVFRASSGLWAIRGTTRAWLGTSGDRPAPGDYDGDARADPAVYRPSRGMWAIRGLTVIHFGNASDLPVPGDYGTRGRFLPAVFRPDSGMWAVRSFTRFFFGAASDYPVPSRSGESGSDLAGLFRPSSGLWSIRDLTRFIFGTVGDLPSTR